MKTISKTNPDGEIAPAFISKSYRRKLLKREKLMAQFLNSII